jgi:hypothetical protein
MNGYISSSLSFATQYSPYFPWTQKIPILLNCSYEESVSQKTKEWETENRVLGHVQRNVIFKPKQVFLTLAEPHLKKNPN